MRERSSIGKALSRAVDANLRYTALATRLATSALESAFSAGSSIATEMGPKAAAVVRQVTTQVRAGQQPGPSVQQKPAAILLEGETGSTATGFFVVENSLPHAISTSIEVSPLIARDGRKIDSALRFDPGMISLAAGEQVIARVTAKISRRLVAGARYEGEILVPGVAGARIPIVLRRTLAAAPHKVVRKKTKPVSKSAKAAVKKGTTAPRRPRKQDPR
jgi:hypothetical protein